MREHQIVITLKPEQFLEVQRLARAARAKSMGVFVRQKLLAALGIDAGRAAAKAGNGTDIEPVLEELKRLHSELKSFVAESMSIYVADAAGNGADSAGGISASPVHAAILDAQQALAEDELEETADRTFAISPRLGSVEDEEVFDDHAYGNDDDMSTVERQELEAQMEEARREEERELVEEAEARERDRQIDYVPFYDDDDDSADAEPSPVRDPLQELLGDEEQTASEPRTFEQYDEPEHSAAPIVDEDDGTALPAATTFDDDEDVTPPISARQKMLAQQTEPKADDDLFPPPNPAPRPITGGPPPKRRKPNE